MNAKEPLPESLRKLGTILLKRSRRQLFGLLGKHSSVFQIDGLRNDVLRYDIKTSSLPTKQPPWRFPIGRREEGEKQIAEMLDNDVIELSSCPWGRPCFVGEEERILSVLC